MKWVGKHRAEQDSDVCEFEVIGELKEDSELLLLRGCNGRFYSLDTGSGHIEALDPDNSFAMDVSKQTSVKIQLPHEAVA